MPISNLKKASVAAAVGGVMAGMADAAGDKAVDRLISKIKDTSEKVRTEAWLRAGQVGAGAVKPLARVMTDKELEVARAAKRGLWRMVRDVGGPGADAEKKAVIGELVGLLGNEQPASVRREVLWMLSEIGGEESVEPIASLLSKRELREDARMVLQRIPGEKSVAALKTTLKAAPDDFKLNIAQSLRQRGVKVRGLSCVKLAPTKKTKVEAIK